MPAAIRDSVQPFTEIPTGMSFDTDVVKGRGSTPLAGRQEPGRPSRAHKSTPDRGSKKLLMCGMRARVSRSLIACCDRAARNEVGQAKTPAVKGVQSSIVGALKWRLMFA